MQHIAADLDNVSPIAPMSSLSGPNAAPSGHPSRTGNSASPRTSAPAPLLPSCSSGPSGNAPLSCHSGFGVDAKKDGANGNGKYCKSARARGSRGRQRNSRGQDDRCIRNPNPRSSRGFASSAQKPGDASHYDTEDTIMTGAHEVEVGSVFNSGSKKQNLSHLITFDYKQRSTNQYDRGQRASRRARKPPVARRKYRKEQYLQANCQFAVRAEADLSDHLTDPDTLVSWDVIEQVGLHTSGVPSCPICLYPPTAAKIARCGHVFCWPCILHFLALSDDTYRRCPICEDPICKSDLKSVVSLVHEEFRTGDEIEMRLMRRQRGSLFAMPVSSYTPGIEGKHPRMNQDMKSYSKLLTMAPQDVCNVVIQRERNELLVLYSDEKDEPEACFIEEALQYLEERESTLSAQICLEDRDVPEASAIAPLPSDETDLRPTDGEGVRGDTNGVSWSDGPRNVSSSSDGASSIDVEEDPLFDYAEVVSAKDLDISSAEKAGGGPVRKDTFYFYQASDGQAIFLHALNVQMLIEEYGAFEKCPWVIKGKILEKEGTSMSEELRDKLRYLSHVPLTGNFEVCEIKLGSPLVSKRTIDKFGDQIELRHRRRAKRLRDEKRREKCIKLHEDKLMEKLPEKLIRIESNYHFPEVGTDRSHGGSSLPSGSSPHLLAHELQGSDGSDKGAKIPHMQEGAPSFARMVRDGRAGPPNPPPVTTIKRSETVPSLSGNRRRGSEGEMDDPESYVPPPPQASIGDALALALERAASIGSTEENKKGKKGKKYRGTKVALTSSVRPTV